MPSFTTTSLNRKTNSRSRGIHQLKGSFDVIVEGIEEQKALEAWFCELGGRANEFEIDLPERFKTTGISNPLTTSNEGIGTSSMTLSGFTGTITAGSFFNMLNDSKTYISLNTVSGGGTINFRPALRQSQLTSSLINFTTPTILARLTSDLGTFNYIEQGSIVRYSIDWEEAL